MKKLIVCAGALALAACNNAEAPATEEVAEVEAPVATTTMEAGTYEVTLPDGTKGTTRIDADGSYADMNPDGTENATGSWTGADGQTCFTPTDGTEACWTNGPMGEDGSWTATGPGGETVTIRKMDTEPVA